MRYIFSCFVVLQVAWKRDNDGVIRLVTIIIISMGWGLVPCLQFGLNGGTFCL